ncbi:vanadium-dependent haloperoxidase [Dyadobacter sp. CY323]|uniref:vanadium-dependent haloperoxidase n=1 Tax=Dyadobacter sp. CY323 TaxID=2907302 RepID=UPI001F1A76C3|nr:vanadium-dependent haloperoxidase [Dyadobacter sp. CY323]MCE6990808.1 vanadium-dependent haloperoxidase [Dyadobacter sp. CY323]
MAKFSNILLFAIFTCIVFGCRKKSETTNLAPETIGQVTLQMTDVMVHDVTNPPLSARFFSYACLAGYEVLAQNDPAYKSMHGVLNGFPVITKPAVEDYSYQLACALAMLETAKKMQPSGALLQKYQNKLIDSCRTLGFDDATIAGSQQYALEISKQILKYAKADRYNRISNFPRYEPTGLAGHWYPTPPGYFPPVEPFFKTIRPFTLDTVSQFQSKPPIAFSESKSSEFYKLMKLNYDDKENQEHKVIAAFWDCNPFALENKGHLLVGMKKISPGAHWLGITDIACRQSKADFGKTLLVTMSVSIGLMDSFMTCWDEKYRSNRIRPETAIRKFIDPTWKPFLQTPPFPEYLSGHSVISASSAVILTHYFGENFAYTDTVEERFNLKARKFKSFEHASQEAAISRFYGGIHFMDAIDNGVVQGKEVGKWVIKTLEGGFK